MVVLTAPEAFFVAAQLRKRPKVVAAIDDVHQRTRDLTLDERLKAKVFCPLLEDAICSVYAARPLGCHAFVSADLNACLAAFELGQTPNIPMPNSYVSTRYTCRILLLAALKLAGLNSAVYEMNAALAAILAQDNAEARWLAGEDILAAVPTTQPPPPQFEDAIAKMAAFVAPTV